MALILEKILLAVHLDVVGQHSDLMPELVHGTALFAAHEVIDAVIDVNAFAFPAGEFSARNRILLVDLGLKARVLQDDACSHSGDSRSDNDHFFHLFNSP